MTGEDLLPVLAPALLTLALGSTAAWAARRLAGFAPPWMRAAAFGLAGAVTVSTLLTLPMALWAPALVLGWSLSVLTLVDAADFRLPDLLTLPLIGTGLAGAPWWQPDVPLLHVAIAHGGGAALGYGSFALLAALYRARTGQDGLGFGDAKLAAAAGAWLGWAALPSVVLIGSVAGLGAVLARRLIRGPASLRQPIPFGPALCLGFWLVWLYGPLSG